MSDWKKICAVSDVVENELKEFDIDGTKLVAARSGSDIYVYPLRCPHMDEPLSTGMCDGATVTCSFHLWQWDSLFTLHNTIGYSCLLVVVCAYCLGIKQANQWVKERARQDRLKSIRNN